MNGSTGVKWLLGAICFVMIGAVLAGLNVLGSPAHQRALRLDQARVQDLSVISRGIANYWKQHHALPVDLSGYDVSGGRSVDHATGKPYVYSLLSVESYSLCATFDAASDPGNEAQRVPYIYVQDAPKWTHPAGQHCFVFLVDHGSSPVR
jgi:hypothetical protein